MQSWDAKQYNANNAVGDMESFWKTDTYWRHRIFLEKVYNAMGEL